MYLLDRGHTLGMVDNHKGSISVSDCHFDAPTLRLPLTLSVSTHVVQSVDCTATTTSFSAGQRYTYTEDTKLKNSHEYMPQNPGSIHIMALPFFPKSPNPRLNGVAVGGTQRLNS